VNTGERFFLSTFLLRRNVQTLGVEVSKHLSDATRSTIVFG